MTLKVMLPDAILGVTLGIMVHVDPRDALLAEKDALLAEKDARIAELEERLAARDARIAELEAQVAMLLRRVAELETLLGQNSTNSSRPPSSDRPGVRRRKPRKRKKKKRSAGGQRGHAPHRRELLPPEQVDDIIDVKPPDECARCQGELKGGEQVALRHQVVEVPPLKPLVTEYRCLARECTRCGTLNRASLPPEVAGHGFGERLSAMVCLLVGRYRLSKRLVLGALEDLLGVRLSLGAVHDREQEMSHALRAPMEQAEAFIRDQRSIHMDETGWFEGKKRGRSRRAWLWLGACERAAVFRITPSRGSEVARSLLGEDFAGFLTSDRWSAYNWYDSALRQLCWSHLTRDFQGFIDREGEGARIGRLLMRERNRMFKWWHRVRDGTMTRGEFTWMMRRVERQVGRLLHVAAKVAEKKTAGMAREILKWEQALWTFVQVEGLEPTNNFAERLIRSAVIYRKTSFGTQSPEGSRFMERILTVVTTLKLQQRGALDFLTEALRSRRRGLPAPSLLPIMTDAQTRRAA
jgi:transposase